MFEYFPGNYSWSSSFMMGLMAGGQLGEMHRGLGPLRGTPAGTEAWAAAWHDMACEQERFAQDDLADGFERSAGLRLLRAAMYLLAGERHVAPGVLKTRMYDDAEALFERAVELAALPVEHVDIPSPDGSLPGLLVRPPGMEAPPVVVVLPGFDVTKEMLYGMLREAFSARGVALLIVDTPGTGEPLRRRGVASRPDYEVTTSAIIDFLERAPDVDPGSIGLLGFSLGGYYAARSAAFETRIRALATWGAVYDYGAIWRQRVAGTGGPLATPAFQLPWVMGARSMIQALEKADAFSLEGIAPRISQPLLVVHGEGDRAIPVAQARRLFSEVRSFDRSLRIFGAGEGGAEHVQADEPDAARELIADWFATRL